MATNREMQTEFAIFKDVWGLLKKYYDMPKGRDLESVINEAAAINQKYNCRLCAELILAVVDELDRRHKCEGDT